MATILEQLVVLFPRAELHVIHLAIDLYPSDLDAAVAQLIGWGCDFEPEPPTHAADRPQVPPRLQRAATAQPSSAASFVPQQPSRTVGRWSSDTLVSWGHRPWLELYVTFPSAHPDPQFSHLTPHSYGQNFPVSRHSRLAVTLGEHELAAEAQSVFSLLPDALMLQIACSCNEVRASHTRHLQTQLSHSAGNSHANRRRVSPLAPVCSRPRSLARALPCCLAR